MRHRGKKSTFRDIGGFGSIAGIYTRHSQRNTQSIDKQHCQREQNLVTKFCDLKNVADFCHVFTSMFLLEAGQCELY
jgi:hypothetical protein